MQKPCGLSRPTSYIYYFPFASVFFSKLNKYKPVEGFIEKFIKQSISVFACCFIVTFYYLLLAHLIFVHLNELKIINSVLLFLTGHISILMWSIALLC